MPGSTVDQRRAAHAQLTARRPVSVLTPEAAQRAHWRYLLTPLVHPQDQEFTSDDDIWRHLGTRREPFLLAVAVRTLADPTLSLHDKAWTVAAVHEGGVLICEDTAHLYPFHVVESFRTVWKTSYDLMTYHSGVTGDPTLPTTGDDAFHPASYLLDPTLITAIHDPDRVPTMDVCAEMAQWLADRVDDLPHRDTSLLVTPGNRLHVPADLLTDDPIDDEMADLLLELEASHVFRVWASLATPSGLTAALHRVHDNTLTHPGDATVLAAGVQELVDAFTTAISIVPDGYDHLDHVAMLGMATLPVAVTAAQLADFTCDLSNSTAEQVTASLPPLVPSHTREDVAAFTTELRDSHHDPDHDSILALIDQWGHDRFLLTAAWTLTALFLHIRSCEHHRDDDLLFWIPITV